MSWNKIKDRFPPQGKKVLIWRHTREKYSICSYETAEEEAIKCGSFDKYWMTEYRMCHEISEEDVWMEFPAYSEMKEYK